MDTNFPTTSEYVLNVAKRVLSGEIRYGFSEIMEVTHDRNLTVRIMTIVDILR